MDIAEELEDIQFLVAEPNVKELPKRLKGFDNAELKDYNDAIDEADVVLLLVDHKEFKAFDKSKFEDKRLIDTKGLWD